MFTVCFIFECRRTAHEPPVTLLFREDKMRVSQLMLPQTCPFIPRLNRITDVDLQMARAYIKAVVKER